VKYLVRILLFAIIAILGSIFGGYTGWTLGIYLGYTDFFVVAAIFGFCGILIGAFLFVIFALLIERSQKNKETFERRSS